MFKNKFVLLLVILALGFALFTQFKKSAQKSAKKPETKVTEKNIPETTAAVKDGSEDIVALSTGDEEKAERVASSRNFENGRLVCTPLDGRGFCELFKVPLESDYGVIIKEKNEKFPADVIAVKARANEPFKKADELMAHYPNRNVKENGFLALHYFLESHLQKDLLRGFDEYAMNIVIDEVDGERTKSSFYVYLPPGMIHGLLAFYEKNLQNFKSSKDLKFFQEAKNQFSIGVLTENYKTVKQTGK